MDIECELGLKLLDSSELHGLLQILELAVFLSIHLLNLSLFHFQTGDLRLFGDNGALLFDGGLLLSKLLMSDLTLLELSEELVVAAL